MTKTPPKFHTVVPWLGLCLFLLVLLGLATKRRQIGASEVFVVCYTGILFTWPFNDVRFWLPVIPLLIAYSLIAVNKLRFPKLVITIYCIVFATLGFVALAYSSRISFADCKFPDEYGDGYLRPTYRAAFPSCKDDGDPGGHLDKVDAKALRLLREYR
jgi:hypothetical protein